jgi:hypothetical protein
MRLKNIVVYVSPKSQFLYTFFDGVTILLLHCLYGRKGRSLYPIQ